MALDIIDIGTAPAGTDGDNLRAAMQKIKDNFDEIYSTILIGDGGTNNENLLSPMPDSVDGVRNTINEAGVATCNASTNIGAAAGAGAHNRIASETKPATGAGSGPTIFNTHFVDDDLSGVTTIVVASIFGAYDQVVNSTGSSCIASPHSYIKHSTGGHNNLIGGSTLLISGTTDRSVGVGGLLSVIHDSTYSCQINCLNTVIDSATRAIAIGCNGTTITGTRVIAACSTNQTIGGSDGLVVGTVTYSGAYSLCVGQSITHSGSYGITVGNDLTNVKNNVLLAGVNGIALQHDSFNFCGTQIATRGDVAFCMPIDGDAATTNQNRAISLIQFPAGVNCSGIMRVSLIGKIVGTNSILAYTSDIAFRINGDTINLIDNTGSGSNLYRTLTFNDTSLTWAAGNNGLVRIAANVQLLRLVTPAFTDADVVVRWVGSSQITLTREDSV
jgi:hypothetical protein